MKKQKVLTRILSQSSLTKRMKANKRRLNVMSGLTKKKKR